MESNWNAMGRERERDWPEIISMTAKFHKVLRMGQILVRMNKWSIDWSV